MHQFEQYFYKDDLYISAKNGHLSITGGEGGWCDNDDDDEEREG